MVQGGLKKVQGGLKPTSRAYVLMLILSVMFILRWPSGIERLSLEL